MSEQQPPDEQLVEQAAGADGGDVRAFDQLVGRHQGRVVANCRYITRSGSDAEDLAQEVFVKVYFALRRFERRSSFRTWLNRIKVNHCLNFLKKRERQQVVDMEDEDMQFAEAARSSPEVEARDEATEQRRRIAVALEGLQDTLRIPLILRDYDELSYQEIADELGIGLSAVKMRIKRARETFRELYEAAGEAGRAAP